ncbi:neuronal acetylcholine receptor subunit beta-2-like [Pecten maximus]|uniref:neuronal acetylcholine receptor subunit beta-2-like n=1 Tax=Pecten maximus TaxID=6579 RepID=UPI001457E6D6|nr:neuronal acetylcholine receptor subunit beta-2-like [Pecten maximus]
MDFRVALVLLHTLYGITFGQRTDDLHRLYTKLTTHYNKDIRPSVDHWEPTIVNASFMLLSIKEYEEKSEMLAVVGIFTFIWQDMNLMWDRNAYGGITSILIPQNKVWLPEVINGKPYEEIEPLGFDRLNVRVYEYGTVLWMPGDVYQTTCSADVTYFPFDLHQCEYIFPPWMYRTDEVYFLSTHDEIDVTSYTPNGLWELKSTEAFVDEDSFDSQLFTLRIQFKRRPIFHIINILVPISVMGILNVLVFLLPAESGERVGFSITVLLAMSVFLTIISDILPNTSQPSIPRMSYLLLADLVISSLITVCTILVLRLHHKSEDDDVPRWLWCLSCTKCCSRRERKKRRPVDESHNNSGTYLGEDTRNKQDSQNSSSDGQPHIVKWKEIADFFDIFFFILFLLVNIAKILVYFLMFISYL